MDFKKYRIAYSPHSNDCTVPGDRRRFVFYANQKNIDFEIADSSKEYDIVYVTTTSNISKWIEYKKKHPSTKLIFEIVDSYLLEKRSLNTYFKGGLRFLTNKDEKFYFNYKKAFISIIKIADAVVCSTGIQKKDIEMYNSNVHVSLDYFSEDISYHKKSFERGDKLKIVWEGQAYTVRNLLGLKKAFKEIADKIELHVITDPKVQYPFKLFNKKTEAILSQLGCPYFLHQWEKNTFSKLIAECDLSVIPIDMTNTLMVNKPENKLLLLWEIGIPVLTSPTPAYKRVMDHAGLNYYCSSDEEWISKIRAFINKTPTEISADMEKSIAYLHKTHTKEHVIQNWDKIFSSLFYKQNKRRNIIH